MCLNYETSECWFFVINFFVVSSENNICRDNRSMMELIDKFP